MVSAAGFGGVDAEALSAVGGEVEGVEVEREVAHNLMVEPLVAGAVQGDVVGCPADAERVAAGGELADEIGELPVVRVPACLGAKDADRVVGDLVPVDEELWCGRVQEDERWSVDRPVLVRGTAVRTKPRRGGWWR